MKIIHKLTLGYLGVALLIALVGHFAANAARDALKKSAGADSAQMARQLVDELDRHIQNEFGGRSAGAVEPRIRATP